MLELNVTYSYEKIELCNKAFSSTCHRRFQEWNRLSVFKKVWIKLLKIYDDLIGINWTWQSIDSISIKSPLGAMTVGNNPTDRCKLGKTKRHISTDKKGIPLSAVISSANTHDIKLVTDVVDNSVINYQTTTSTSNVNYHHLNLNREQEKGCNI